MVASILSKTAVYSVCWPQLLCFKTGSTHDPDLCLLLHLLLIMPTRMPPWGQESCFVHVEVLAHSRHWMNISWMNELSEANPEDGEPPPSGIPGGWNHLLQLLPSVHDHPLTIILCYGGPHGPPVSLRPATGLHKPRWRTSHGEWASLLGRSWWL